MKNKPTDWKDVAQSYYDKAFSLAVLLILFLFLVSPKLEIKAPEVKTRTVEAVEIPPEIKKKIEPPKAVVKPKVQIVIGDELSDEDEEEDIEIIDTIEKTVLDPFEEMVQETSFSTTPKGFIYRDEEPRLIKEARLLYPPAMRRAGIEGTVVLELEILKSGKVGAIDIIESVVPGTGGLDEAAVEYARQLEFEPAKANEEPVAVWVRYPVTFTLE